MKIICSFCHKECFFNLINEGIGHYEYWGAPEYDKQISVVSICCNEHCIDEYGNEITAKEAKEELANESL